MATAASVPLTQNYIGDAQAGDFRCKTLNGVSSSSFTFEIAVPAVTSGQLITVADINTYGFKFLDRIEFCGVAASTSGQISAIASPLFAPINAANLPGGVFVVGQTYCGRGLPNSVQGQLAAPLSVVVSSNAPASFTDLVVKVTLSN